LVEREDLNKVLKEQSLASSGLTDGQSIQVGRLLEATRLVHGSYIITGRKIRIDARVTETESGKIIKSVSVEGTADSVMALEKQLAGQIIDVLGLSRPPGLENPESESVGAVTAYYHGIELLDAGKGNEALIKFQEAADKDPSYSKPVKGIEESFRFLKDFRRQRQQREISQLYIKIEALKRKLRSAQWITYSDWVMSSSSMDPSARQKFQDSPDGEVLMLCDVPARCVWHLMMTRNEAGEKIEEYFGDTKKKEALYRENLKDAAKAARAFPDDPVLAEVLYMEIYNLHFLGDKKAVRVKAEEFLGRYPDYRLIEFVEDWYEQSLSE
jgi:tetratricopeptide (TPR) repeat protein